METCEHVLMVINYRSAYIEYQFVLVLHVNFNHLLVQTYFRHGNK